jgi:hypothetical protein
MLLTLGLKLHELGSFSRAAVAAIYYKIDSYFTNESGDRYIENVGSSGYENDLLLNSGRGIELTTESVDIPIHHTLGADDKKLATSVDVGWVNNLDNTYTGTAVTGDIVGITTSTSGTFKVTITLSSVTEGDVNGYDADGTYVFEETLSASLNLTGTGFTGVVEVVSAEEITNQNSYLTYHDLDTNEIVTIGNRVNGVADSTPELVTNGTFDTDTDWTKETGWTIIGGQAVFSGTPGSVLSQLIVQEGKTYSLTLDLISTDDRCRVGYYSSGWMVIDSLYGAGTHTSVFTAYGSGIIGFYTVTGNSLVIDNVSIKEILPISTTYTFTAQTVNNILTHTTDWSTADQAAIGANQNLIGKLALSGTGAIDELDMELGVDDAWYACMELSGDTLYDARSTDTATIADYTAAVRENADFQTAGIQTTAFQRDALGVPQAYDVTALNFLGDGYGDTKWNPSLESAFWLEEIVDGVVYQHNYDGVNLTTYTDNVAGTPGAHSPENADYIAGKGIYPKVTADPYTENVCTWFVVYTGAYNQESRYNNLAGA